MRRRVAPRAEMEGRGEWRRGEAGLAGEFLAMLEAPGSTAASSVAGDALSSCKTEPQQPVLAAASRTGPARRAPKALGQSKREATAMAAKEAIERKRMIARQASRRYRDRRRDCASVLQKRSRELERETNLLRARAADLRAELTVLRHVGVVDLEKENRLLRLEIKRHKCFIERVMGQVQDPDTSTTWTPEERYRVVQGGLEAAKFHILAMAYASAHDQSWRRSPTRFADLQGPTGVRLPGIHVTKFQYRPSGVPRAKAACLNTRFEWKMSTTRDEYFKRFGMPSASTFTSAYGSTVVRQDVTPAEFASIAAELGENEGIRILTQRETQASGGAAVSNENVFAVMTTAVDLCVPSVFPELSRGLGLAKDHTVRALVRCISNLRDADPACAAVLSDAGDGVGPATSHCTQGLLACEDPTDASSAWFVSLNSVPTGQDLYGMPIREIFDDQGLMHPNAHADIQRLRREVLRRFDAP